MKQMRPKENYVNEIIEWQNKQYLSGEYLGGNFPPAVRWPSRLYGYSLTVIGGFGLLVLIFSVLKQTEFSFNTVLGMIFPFFIMALSFSAGISILRCVKI